jgi:hypothetical protein
VQLPIAAGVGAWGIRFGSGGCAAFGAGGAATISGDVLWEDAAGRVIGLSRIPSQPFDLRGTKVVVDRHSDVLPGQVLSLRLAVDPTPCVASSTGAVIASTTGRTTGWIPGE